MVITMASFVAPIGYVDLDNDCAYSIDLKSTRSREEINPKEDLAFYFNTYIVPKYGLNNINVNNVASFMKDLEMNWTKLDSDLKGKVMDILVDGILAGDTQFKTDLMTKLNPVPPPSSFTNVSPDVGPNVSPNVGPNVSPNVSGGKSNFGAGTDNSLLMNVGIAIIILGIAYFVFDNIQKNKVGGYAKFK